MEVNIKRTDQSFGFEAENGKVAVPIGASEVLVPDSGDNWRPMELLLASLGSCMSIDILNILYKQKQKVDNYSVKLKGARQDHAPNAFEEVSLEIELSGALDESKVQRAIALSRDKYCSVYHSLSSSLEVTIKYKLKND